MNAASIAAPAIAILATLGATRTFKGKHYPATVALGFVALAGIGGSYRAAEDNYRIGAAEGYLASAVQHGDIACEGHVSYSTSLNNNGRKSDVYVSDDMIQTFRDLKTHVLATATGKNDVRRTACENLASLYSMPETAVPPRVVAPARGPAVTGKLPAGVIGQIPR